MPNSLQPEVLLHDPHRGVWLHFTAPRTIVQARTLSEVIPALETVQAAVDATKCHAAGFVSYEAAPAFDSALTVSSGPHSFPLLWFGLFPAPATHGVFPSTCPAKAIQLPWTPSLSREAYTERMARLREYLYRGDTYQVNFTLRLLSTFAGDPRELFVRLVQAQGPHYSAWIHTGEYAIASASPELFFRLDGDLLESRPMKGTTRRGRTTREDIQQADALLHSEKNRAENVMIVDMIRNDMGRIAIPGTVTPASLFDVERYPTVWQMTSTVRCRTKAVLTEILKALFPCASITGAPKRRTMEIIAELEDSPRRLYTGAIGYASPGRQAQFSVAIRTILQDCDSGTAEYGVGGGIVWDSSPQDEYDECLLKAAVLLTPPDFSLLETLRWTRTGGFYLLERHLDRLMDSATYFDIPASLHRIRSCLQEWSATQVHDATSATAMRVRLLVDQEGTPTMESAPLDTGTAAPVRVALAHTPVNPADRFLFHKTTHRSVYEEARAASPEADDVLLYNPAGEITESTIANIVADMDGKLVTPPVKCGLLPGTFRAELLAQGSITEDVIRVADLARCRKIYLISSVRQWRPAVLVN